MSYLKFLADAIHKTRGLTAKHIETVPILETHKGKIAWQGDVEIFELANQVRCYAWGFQDGDEMKAITVLAEPPITTPRKAVQAYILSMAK